LSGYETGGHPPYSSLQGYAAAHNLIKSHASAYKLYNEKYRDSQNG